MAFYQLDGDFEYLSRLRAWGWGLWFPLCDCGCASVAFLSYYLWIAAWYVVSSVMFSSHDEFTAGIFRIKACSFCSFLLIICRLDKVSSVWYNQAEETLIVFYFKQAATGHSKQKQVSEWGSLWLKEILMNGAGDEKRHRGASRCRHALLFSHGTCVTRRPC